MKEHPVPKNFRNWKPTNPWPQKSSNPRVQSQPAPEHEIQPSELVPDSGFEILPISILKISTLESSAPKELFINPVPIQFGAAFPICHAPEFLPSNKPLTGGE